MKKNRVILTIFTLATLVAAGAWAGDAEGRHPGFSLGRLASLVGVWEAKLPQGSARASYELVADGSALLERLAVGDHPAMISVYHRDGDALMMTHYCLEANQPRMRSQSPPDGDELEFSLVDVTNLATPGSGHMHSLRIAFVDDNHFDAHWTMLKQGADHGMPFRFQRVK